MSIRMLAIELYRVMRRVQELEKALEGMNPGSPEREKTQEELRHVRAEENRLKTMLEGAKD
jgi:hypothetical protein